jgi:hypothetical protein
MFAWLKKATDSNTLLGNVVLCGLLVAVLIIWGCVFGGCAVDDRGLLTIAEDGARTRTEHPSGADVVPPAPDVQPVALPDASLPPPLPDAQVPDVQPPSPDVQPPDTAPPLAGLGTSCRADDQCASGVCATGLGVCCERACGACNRCNRSGRCEPTSEGALCNRTQAACAEPSHDGWACVARYFVCKAGVCADHSEDCCAYPPAAPGNPQVCKVAFRSPGCYPRRE